MASDITDFRTWVGARIQDDAAYLTIIGGDVDEAINQAVLTYSGDRPRVRVTSVTGDGTATYAIPTGWNSDYSSIRSVEYPAGNQIPTMLDDGDVIVYHNGTVEQIRFRLLEPPSTETFLLTWSDVHTVDGSESTIPVQDDYAVADLAASIACLMLSARQAQSTDSTIGADAVDYQGGTDRYSRLAAILRKRYEGHVLGSASDPGELGAVVFHDLDVRASDGGDRLLHTGSVY